MNLILKYIFFTIPYWVVFLLIRSRGNELYCRHVTLRGYVDSWSSRVDNNKYELISMSILTYVVLFLIGLIIYFITK